MLLFAVDGAVPEVVNGRVAMLGFFTALIKELATGETFTSQLSYNLTHGVSFAIIFHTARAGWRRACFGGPERPSFGAVGQKATRKEPARRRGGITTRRPRAVDGEGLAGIGTRLPPRSRPSPATLSAARRWSATREA